MSINVPESYVTQFHTMVHSLAEQRFSRLLPTVRVMPVTGESFNFERVGGVEANTVNSLHGDTPLNSTPHSRRWGYIQIKDVADLIDKQSDVQMLIDPTGVYVEKHAGAMGRSIDSIIIAALGGTAVTGHTGTGSTALPAAQKIAVGATGLTIAKLRQSKTKLDKAEVDDMDRFFVCSAEQIENLLTTTEVTSSDYNMVKTLVNGEVDTFMGFKFIRTQLLTKTGNDRFCYAYARSALTMGIAQPIEVEVNTRPDKRNSKQIYTWMALGAVRGEEERVVEVSCLEA